MRIHARSFELTAAIDEHVRRRVGAAIAATQLPPHAVQVWLDDVNGHRGGSDKRCRIAISHRSTGDMIVQAIDEDLYASIDAAGDRLKAALRRRLGRVRTIRRAFAVPMGSAPLPGA